MKRPGVFISSTVYDLATTRRELWPIIEEMGLEPISSELSTFPVNPDQNTIENCLNAVRDKADILVLVIGRRYGWETESGQSITHREFLVARGKGIPTYIFVLRQIWAAFPEWERDSSQDFSKLVDSVKVFQFIDQMKKLDEKWIFPFDASDDICQILKNQIAFLFSDSLCLRLKAHAPGIPLDLVHLRGKALEILIEREIGWEYLFFGQMLQDELLKQEDFRNDWKYGVVVGPVQISSAREFVASLNDRLKEGYRLIGNLKTLMTEVFPRACGPLGKTGNASELAYVARRLALLYLETLKWKLTLRSLVVHEKVLGLRDALANFLDSLVVEFDRWSAEYFEKCPLAVRKAQQGEKVELNMLFKPASPDVDSFRKELDLVTPLITSGKLED